MSYANGIGPLQQALSSIAPAATPAASQAAEAAAVKQHSTPVAKADHADQASLSSASGTIVHALEGSDVRSEKVAALQQAIASGSYSVSSSEVAGKMIHSLLE